MSLLSELLETESPVLERALSKILGAWLPRRRWFRSKAKPLSAVRLETHAPLGNESGDAHFCIVKTEFTDGSFERYSLPLVLLDRIETAGLPKAAILGALNTRAGDKILCDASWHPGFRGALFELLTGKIKSEAAKGGGVLAGRSLGEALSPGVSKILAAEQSNTAFAYVAEEGAGGHFVKLYRRLEEAVNPEPEVLRFLREHTAYRHVPRFEASLEWTVGGHMPVTVALMQELVDTRGDAWEYTLENLRAPGAPSPAFIAWVSLLGARVAELHAALASVSTLADFAPEPLIPTDLDRTRAGTLDLLEDAFTALKSSLTSQEKRMEEGVADVVRKVMADRARLEALILAPALAEEDEGDAPEMLKTRTHGDLHLGQIMVECRGAPSPEFPDFPDVRILDFEGEPGRPLAEARRKQSPLRDAAGMLRSFHYAAHTVLRADTKRGRPSDADTLARTLGAAFLKGYFGEGREPSPPVQRLLNLFVVEKAVYELYYELNNRPDWMEIPLRGLLALSGEDGR